MRIKKLGHCCLLIEEKGFRVLTDPGNYSTLQNSEKRIDIILITHEHADHFHIESVKKVLENNPQAVIVTNSTVGKLLAVEAISHIQTEDGETYANKDLTIFGHGSKHAEIYKTWGSVLNTGYFIGERLFYPGDALYDPKRPIEILALPVAGPWVKISESVNYALALKPKIAFPVHDGGLINPGIVHRVPAKVLPENAIEFRVLEIGVSVDF